MMIIVSKTKNSQERTSPTAWLTAYLRTFSDIPYAKEIFNEFYIIKKKSGGFNMFQGSNSPKIAPQIEARYKLIEKLLTKNKVTQVLEVASGLSSRGLDMTRHKNIEYVEVDLPEIMAQKKEIIKKIRCGHRPNLHLEIGNALNLTDLKSATIYFNQNKQIAVVNEGLMRYFKFGEKASFAKNVHALLMRFGGVWITSDITLRQVIRAEDAADKGTNKRTKEITGVDIYKNAFKSVEDAKRFFKQLGFSVEVHSFLEVKNTLSSPKKLDISKRKLEETIKHAVVFAMKLI